MQRLSWARTGCGTALAMLAATAMGDLIVYEGFDCGAANNALMDGLAGATSFGFDSGSVWTNASISGTNVYRTAGRTFGQVSGASLLRTTGGCVYGYAAYKANTNEWRSARLSRPLDTTANTLWGSLLVERDYGGRCVHSLLVGQSPTASDGTAEVDVGAREFWGQNQGAIRIKGRQQILSGTGTGEDTAYLILYKVDRLNASSGSTVATQWILTNAQYAHHKTGGLTEPELDSATLGSEETQVLQRGSVTNTAPSHALPAFNSNSHLILLSLVSEWSTIGAFYDEVRISNASLDETTPLGPGIAVENSVGGLSLTADSASLRGKVVSPGDTSVDAYVFWGTEDKGTNAVAWAHSALVATGLGGSAAVGTNLTHTVTGLDRDAAIPYRFAVSNALNGLVWAPASGLATGTFSTDGFRRRLPIDFDGYAKSLVLTNFPALVRFTAEQLGNSANGNGNDLRFTDDDNAPLDYEIQNWNATDGWVAWVKVPELTATTRIWVWAGNESLTGYASYYARKGSVWTGGTVGKWHFDEQVTDNQTTGSHDDATGNGLAARQNRNASVADGRIGRAQRTFADGTNAEYMQVTNATATALDAGSTFTLSGWLRWNGAAPSGNSRIASRKNAFTDNDGWELLQLKDTSSPIRYPLLVRGSGNSTSARFDGLSTNPPYINLFNTSWWHLTMVYQGTTVRAYTNGVLAGSGTIAAAVDNNRPLTFGNISTPDAPNTFNGDFDEWRLDTDDRPADWVWAVWKNMADNTGFQTYGPVEALGYSLILLR